MFPFLMWCDFSVFKILWYLYIIPLSPWLGDSKEDLNVWEANCVFRVSGGEKGWSGGGKEENGAATAAIEVVKILCQRLSLCLTSFFSTTLLMYQIDLVMLSVKINHNNYVYFIHFLLALLKRGGGGEHTQHRYEIIAKSSTHIPSPWEEDVHYHCR